MANPTPDLRLPSPPHDAAVSRLVRNYTAWRQRHVRANNLPRVARHLAEERPGLQPAISRVRESNALTVKLEFHGTDTDTDIRDAPIV